MIKRISNFLIFLLVVFPLCQIATITRADSLVSTSKGASESESSPQIYLLTQDGRSYAFSVEWAITPDQKRRGLMFRKEMLPDTGMVFDFDEEKVVSMWMKNTLIPLDMLFIDSTGTVSHIVENTTPESTAVISSVVPVRWVLEVKGGTARRLGLKKGDHIKF